MATIIEFCARTVRPDFAAPTPTEPANIVLFPGVRYERADAAAANPPAKRGRSRRRDRPDIGD